MLLLALAIWGVAELFEESDELVGEDIEVYEEADDVEGVASPIVENTPDVYDGYREEINDYMAYTKSMKGEMGLGHDFTHDAMTLLATAIASAAEAHDVEMSDNISRSKELVDEIQLDPYATNHADKIRMAAINLTESLERIDKWALNGKNAGALKDLRAEAQSIKAETLTLDQKDDVRSFFNAARGVLSNLK